MHKDRALEVKEVCHVEGQTVYECMYIPPLKGLTSLPFAVFHKDIRKLTSEEVQKVQAQINLEGGEMQKPGVGRGQGSGRGRGRGRGHAVDKAPQMSVVCGVF